MESYTYHLILGSNLGDRLQQLTGAKSILVSGHGKITRESQLYETEPWGYEDQPWFINQVIEFRTHIPPPEFMTLLKKIEVQLGRQPGEKWHARTIDLDILLCGNLILHQPGLNLPHPHLHERNFVLVPLMEIAPLMMHPVLHKTIEDLYAECRDTGEVFIFNPDEHGHPI